MQASSFPIDRLQTSPRQAPVRGLPAPKTYIRELGFWKGVTYLSAAGIFYLGVLALRVTACVVSIFGKCGKNLAEKIRGKADRVYVIHVAHNLACIHSAPIPLLVPSRNLARRDVVRKREDVAAANALRERLLSPGFLKTGDPKMEKELKKVVFKGANKKGICFGASLCFIKSVMLSRCSSETELKKVAQSFASGFPKEAAALQMMHEKINTWPEELSKSANRGVLDLFDREMAEIMKDVDLKRDELLKEVQKGNAQKVFAQFDGVEAEELKKAEARMDSLKKRTPLLKKVALKATQYGKHAKCIGIKVLKRPIHDFLKFDIDLATKERFNALPKGHYIMKFLTKHAGHAISYHKFDFGSYLFDPNRGLMKCESGDPAQDLAKLLKWYPGKPAFATEGSHQLHVFPCELKDK